MPRRDRRALRRARRGRASSTSSTRWRCGRWRGSTTSTAAIIRGPGRPDRGGTARALLRRAHRACSSTSPAASERPMPVSTWSSLAPLALTGLPEDVRRRLVEEHLLDPRRYLAPSGSRRWLAEEPTFKPAFAWWRCWRGPVLDEHRRGCSCRRCANSAMWPQAERIVARWSGRPIGTVFASTTTRSPDAGSAARDFGLRTLLVDLLANCETDGRRIRPPVGG